MLVKYTEVQSVLRCMDLGVQGHAGKGGNFGGAGMPIGLHGSNTGDSILSGSSGNSMTANLHNGALRPTPSFNTSA